MKIDSKIPELENYSISDLEVIGENLLIVPLKTQEKQGFVIPSSNSDKITVGKVIKVGNGLCKESSMKMVVGENDVVIFQEWSAKKVAELGDRVFVVKQSDIICFAKKRG